VTDPIAAMALFLAGHVEWGSGTSSGPGTLIGVGAVTPIPTSNADRGPAWAQVEAPEPTP
jgi:hypothetical protein